jgi:hypothetical protein
MVSFGEKAKIKMAGNLNEGRSYDITTVIKDQKKILLRFPCFETISLATTCKKSYQ